MAKAGTASQVGARDPGATRAALVEAAIATLRSEGYAGASARSIARLAGCNQALVFYHFGSVANLLLAALDETSRRRRERYEAAVAAADGIGGLLKVAAGIFGEDLEEGHMAVLAEMIAGASSTPGLGAEVSARVKPWVEFAEQSVAAAMETLSPSLAQVVPPRDVAYGVVALYLGIELLAHLEGDRSAADSLFATAEKVLMLATGTSAERGLHE